MTVPRPRPTARPRTRRAVVLGGAATLAGLGVGAVAGCEVAAPGTDPPARPSGSPTTPGARSSGSATPESSSTQPAEGAGTRRGATLVEGVLVELAAATGLVLAAQRGARRLRPDLRPLLVLHGEHVRLLGARLPTEPDPGAAGGTARQRLAAVRRREERLERALADAAVAADSGPLARLLASMSAAVAQRLVVLPGSPR